MMITPARPAFGCLLLVVTLILPAGAAPVASPHPRPAANPGPGALAGLYSPRARRTAQNYLRLRLLELREADLERARAVIERRLEVDSLLTDPIRPPEDARGRNTPYLKP